MIIRKKNIPNKKTQSSIVAPRGSIINKEDLILDVDNVINTFETMAST